MRLTQAAHHFLMVQAATDPRGSHQTVLNARQHLEGRDIADTVYRNFGGIIRSNRRIDWKVEKDSGIGEGWLHIQIRSDKSEFGWRIDDNSIHFSGLPRAQVLAYIERQKSEEIQASSLVDLPYLRDRRVLSIRTPSEREIYFMLSGSYRNDPIRDYPQSMGEWRNAGIAYVKRLQDEFRLR